jgi:Protein of unknown function (DUF3224)
MARRISLLLAVVLAVGALGAAPAVAGSGSVHVSGYYRVDGIGETACEPVGVTRLRCTTTGLASTYERGDLDGTSSSSFEQIIDCARGRTAGYGSETFTGSIHGVSGTLTWQLGFTSDFDCSTFFPSNLRIVAVPVWGSGDLAGLHGVLLFADDSYRGVLG